MRLLQRLRSGGHGREAPVLSAVLDVACPQLLQQRHHLEYVRSALLGGDPVGHSGKLEVEGASRDTELQAAIGVDVDQPGFTGESQRVPVGRHRNPDTKANARGPGRPVGEDRERIRCMPELEPVVLRGPGGHHAALLGDAQEVERVLPDLAYIHGRIVAQHVDGDREFHDAASSEVAFSGMSDRRSVRRSVMEGRNAPPGVPRGAIILAVEPGVARNAPGIAGVSCAWTNAAFGPLRARGPRSRSCLVGPKQRVSRR